MLACRPGLRMFRKFGLGLLGAVIAMPALANPLPSPPPPVFAAAEAGNTARVEEMLSTDRSLITQTYMADTSLLQWAARLGKGEIVDLLLDRGADTRHKDIYDRTPLHDAATPRIATALLEHGADVTARDILGCTPLLAAISEGYASDDVVRVLLERGANVQDKDSKGLTAMDLAVKGQKTGIIKLLQAKSSLQ